jgi:hypothetical protein
MNQKEEFDHEAWESLSYEAPDYVPGSHPMDNDAVTWHHIWEKPPVEHEVQSTSEQPRTVENEQASPSRQPGKSPAK